MRSEAGRQGHALSSSRALQIKPPELRALSPTSGLQKDTCGRPVGRPPSVAAAPVLIAVLALMLLAADKWLEMSVADGGYGSRAAAAATIASRPV